jgi:hypothetical protein
MASNIFLSEAQNLREQGEIKVGASAIATELTTTSSLYQEVI